jgi:catechol 2,3-dioxygenase-like lactoylglutathione lyase family enzyme/ketosteroid isomerase-like protein
VEVTVDGLDHLVLTVRDLAVTCEFYHRVLGMEVVTFGAGRRALAFGTQKINLHEAGREFEPKAKAPTPGSGDLCFLTATPLRAWIDRLAAQGVPLEDGPVRRTGAQGPIESIYVRDPDGNLLEIANAIAPADGLAPLRAWLTRFQECVRAVDFDSARSLCGSDLVAFGTVASLAEGLDRVVEAQWRNVWPHIREFTIRLDRLWGEVRGDHAWVAAPWDSLGTRPDGATFARPGRLTIIFERRDGRWLATHTHVSLVPER